MGIMIPPVEMVDHDHSTDPVPPYVPACNYLDQDRSQPTHELEAKLQQCAQSAAAFAQVKMCLVINKIDRLVLETRLTPREAYERLKAIVAHVNMVVSAFSSEAFISNADAVLAAEDARAAADHSQCATRVQWELSLFCLPINRRMQLLVRSLSQAAAASCVPDLCT